MTIPALQFRPATHADTDAVVALVESAYRGDASRAGWTTEADFLDGRRTGPDDIAACIDRDHSLILLGERPPPSTGLRTGFDRVLDRLRQGSGQASTGPGQAGELVACAHVAIEHADDGSDAGYFGMFSVSPALQGGGVGKAMLAEAERIARDDWQLTRMRMTVIDIRDELIAFYQRRGYRRTGVLKPFPYGDERFGLPKRDDLRFEVLEKAL